jgi:hypothetical protein
MDNSRSTSTSSGTPTTPFSSPAVMPTCTNRPPFLREYKPSRSIAAEGVDCDLCARATRRLLNRFSHLRWLKTARIDDGNRARLPCLSELCVIYIDRNGPPAERGGYLDCREAHSAAAVDCHKFAASDARAIGDGTPSRHVAAPESRGCYFVDSVGQLDTVHVGGRYTDILLPSSASCNASGRLAAIAQVLNARPTICAGTARIVEWQCNAHARLNTLYACAHFCDYAADLVAERRIVRKFYAEPTPVSVPKVPVASADPGRNHAHKGFILSNGRHRNGVDRKIPAYAMIATGAHGLGWPKSVFGIRYVGHRMSFDQ